MSHTSGSLGFAPDLARMESESADFMPTQAEAPRPCSNTSAKKNWQCNATPGITMPNCAMSIICTTTLRPHYNATSTSCAFPNAFALQLLTFLFQRNSSFIVVFVTHLLGLPLFTHIKYFFPTPTQLLSLQLLTSVFQRNSLSIVIFVTRSLFLPLFPHIKHFLLTPTQLLSSRRFSISRTIANMINLYSLLIQLSGLLPPDYVTHFHFILASISTLLCIMYRVLCVIVYSIVYNPEPTWLQQHQTCCTLQIPNQYYFVPPYLLFNH